MPPLGIWNDPYQVEERFADPERVSKLESAFPKIDSLIHEVAADMKVPGLVVGIVIDGRIAHVAAAGHRSIADQAPLTGDAVFRIASVTKTMTSAAIVKLRDAGKLSLDAPAAKYLPELAKVRYPTRDSRPITVRHLLTHSSGLARDVHGAQQGPSDVGPSTSELGKLLDGMPVSFPPGSRVEYSNLGFSLLGVVIERVAKMSYRDYLTKSFFEPLGMRSAAWERKQVPGSQLAIAYETKQDGTLVPIEKHDMLGFGDSSGGLYLSVSDLGRWLAWQLSGYPARSEPDTGPLARASIREMHDVSGGVGVHVTSPFVTLESWTAEPWAGGMSLGWGRTSLCDLGILVEKSGRIDNYYTEVGFFPNHGIGLLMQTNTAHRNGLKRRAFFDVLKLLRETGGMVPRVRIARNVPALDKAFARLLGVLNQWDEGAYQAMLTPDHKRGTPMASEQAELAAYAKLHGKCASGSIVRFDSSERARYALECERGHFEMSFSVFEGLIGGFTGYSTNVEADPKARAAAEAALADRKRKERLGQCKLGALKERSGTSTHRFALTCVRGKQAPVQRELSIDLDASGNAKPDSLDIVPASSSECSDLQR